MPDSLVKIGLIRGDDIQMNFLNLDDRVRATTSLKKRPSIFTTEAYGYNFEHMAACALHEPIGTRGIELEYEHACLVYSNDEIIFNSQTDRATLTNIRAVHYPGTDIVTEHKNREGLYYLTRLAGQQVKRAVAEGFEHVYLLFRNKPDQEYYAWEVKTYPFFLKRHFAFIFKGFNLNLLNRREALKRFFKLLILGGTIYAAPLLALFTYTSPLIGSDHVNTLLIIEIIIMILAALVMVFINRFLDYELKFGVEEDIQYLLFLLLILLLPNTAPEMVKPIYKYELGLTIVCRDDAELLGSLDNLPTARPEVLEEYIAGIKKKSLRKMKLLNAVHLHRTLEEDLQRAQSRKEKNHFIMEHLKFYNRIVDDARDSGYDETDQQIIKEVLEMMNNSTVVRTAFTEIFTWQAQIDALNNLKNFAGVS